MHFISFAFSHGTSGTVICQFSNFPPLFIEPRHFLEADLYFSPSSAESCAKVCRRSLCCDWGLEGEMIWHSRHWKVDKEKPFRCCWQGYLLAGFNVCSLFFAGARGAHSAFQHRMAIPSLLLPVRASWTGCCCNACSRPRRRPSLHMAASFYVASHTELPSARHFCENL